MNDAEPWVSLEETRGSPIQLTIPVPPGCSPSEVAGWFLGSLLEVLDAQLVEYQLLPERVRAIIRPNRHSAASGSGGAPQRRETRVGPAPTKKTGPKERR